MSSYGYSIEPVPRDKRGYGFMENFTIWFGAGISIAEFWAGALLVAEPLSLGLKLSLLAIILGHAVGNLLLSIVGLAGADSGLPTMVLARKPLGLKGSYLPSILNYLQLIGWTAVMLVVGALAMDSVSNTLWGLSLYHVWIIFLGIIVTLWTLVGPEKWGFLEEVAAALLLILSVWLTYVVLTRIDLGSLWAVEESWAGFWVALDLVIAMPVSWAPLIADYARFSKKPSHAFWGSYIGYFISSGLFYFLGALSNLTLKRLDPISIIVVYGLGVPAMLIIIFSTATTTFLDIYSAAITYKNVFSKADARKQIIFVGVLGTVLALIFPIEEYEWFLLLIGGAFVSLTAILVMDYLLDKETYKQPEKILNPGKTMDYSAITIWGIGFIFYMLLAAASLIPGAYIPVFTETGNTLGSSIPTLILISLLYTLIKHPKKH
ncbi:putative hydroxymethylpyrimidine transporter CytX [Staphylothermus hellenicus]|uniref:putative hydroxymethylpyrimidine transporter CytX n=1 Tax=Staphylothermus hellenicus TaxID=84599 RepID=UPI000A8729BE|nr:putative hydroxymethylpyrimidine transporter CytX [Staphylothermus hellenicus]